MRARRLSSEIWRHLIGIAVVLGPVGVAQGMMLSTAGGEDLGIDALVLVTMLFAYGLYGPLYLGLTAWAFRHRRGEALRHELRASRSPRGWKGALLAFGPKSWGAFVVLIALLAVFGLALSRQLANNPWLLGGAIVAIFGSWILLVAIFAVEYARLWADRHSFAFPDDKDATRSLSDFLYLSVQVATTFATSDVAVTSTRARKTVTVQTIVAYAYTTGIMALFVSFLLSGLPGASGPGPAPTPVPTPAPSVTPGG